MLFRILLGIIIISSCMLPTQAQADTSIPDQLQKSNGKYFYMDKIYSYKDLGGVFHDHKDFDFLHKKAMRKRNSSTIFGFITIGIGVWAVILANNCEELGCIAVIIPMGLGAITGSISLIQLASFHNTKKESLQSLRYSLGQRNLGMHRGPSLSIGLKNSGIGIFYDF